MKKRTIAHNPVVRTVLFVIVAALFQALFFSAADFVSIPVYTCKDVFILTAQWSVVFGALCCLVAILACNRYLFAALFPLLTLAASLLAYFRYSANAAFTPMILDAALENDWRTSAELCTPALVVFVVVAQLLSAALVWYRWHRIVWSRAWTLLFFGGVLLWGIFRIDRLREPVANRIPFNLYFSTRDYCRSRTIVRSERPDHTAGAYTTADSLTVVFVLGESLRSDHLALNGYERNTTPCLARESVYTLPHIYSEQTYTFRAVPHLLTRADSTDYERAYEERSFISYFNACGFRTSWLANQEDAASYVYFMNECDTLVYAHIDKNSYVFDQWLDGDLLPDFDRLLNDDAPKQLIILHTIGSHWWYNSHFPDEFARFQPVVKSKILTTNTREEMINSYDNTVLYTDYFLSQLIGRLRDRKAILVYQSDHGENLGEDGLWLHASGSPFTHDAAGLIWMSPQYIEAYPHYLDRLSENRSKHWRNDYLFHTLLDAASISTPYLEPSLSLFR